MVSIADGSKPLHATVLSQQIAQELADGNLELPVLPEVAAEVLSSSLDEQADASHLADLIHQDQTLTAHVLKVVNSPAFRGASEIVALQQAIARLGMERIREIALTVSLKSALIRPGRFERIINDAWRVSLASGLWAKEVARALRKNVETAYLSGLLHNIGLPLIAHRLGEFDPEVSEDDALRVVSQLTIPAGELLITQWQLPDFVVPSIRYQNDFLAAGEAIDSVAMTSCAIALAQWMCLRSLLITEVCTMQELEHLNLYPEDISLLLEKQDQVSISLESMF